MLDIFSCDVNETKTMASMKISKDFQDLERGITEILLLDHNNGAINLPFISCAFT